MMKERMENKLMEIVSPLLRLLLSLWLLAVMIITQMWMRMMVMTIMLMGMKMRATTTAGSVETGTNADGFSEAVVVAVSDAGFVGDCASTTVVAEAVVGYIGPGFLEVVVVDTGTVVTGVVGAVVIVGICAVVSADMCLAYAGHHQRPAAGDDTVA